MIREWLHSLMQMVISNSLWVVEIWRFPYTISKSNFTTLQCKTEKICSAKIVPQLPNSEIWQLITPHRRDSLMHGISC